MCVTVAIPDEEDTVPETVFGLPTHAIVVHATVVLLPLAALVVLLHAFWLAARRRLGVVTPLLAGLALVLVPLSTESGENLEHAVGENALVVAAGLWLVDRRRARPSGVAEPRWLPVVAALLTVVAVLGTVQQIVRVGHAGAQATWDGVVSTSSATGDGDGD